MTTLFKNNAYSQLAAPAGAGDATITLQAGTGARFPAPGADSFFVTVEDRSAGKMEIMLCTARAGDVLTVTRAQEGTAAQSFAVPALVLMRLTAGMLLALQSYAYDKAAADARFVNVTGDTVTGSLVYNDGTITHRMALASGGEMFTGTFSNHPLNVQVNNSNVGRWTQTNLRIGTVNGEGTGALLTVRRSGDSIEFGHASATFGSAIGAQSNGMPYIAFNGLGGTTANTYKTVGVKGAVLKGDTNGGLIVLTLPTASADNQAGTVLATLSSAGTLLLIGQLDLSNAAASQIKFGNANNSANVDTLDGYKDWVSSSPTIVGFGTTSGVSYLSKRVGDTLEILFNFTAGTPTAVEARIPLLLNGVALTSDATKVPAIRMVGTWTRDVAVAESPTTLVESGVTYLTMGILTGAAGGLTKQLGNAIAAAGQVFSGFATVPISGW